MTQHIPAGLRLYPSEISRPWVAMSYVSRTLCVRMTNSRDAILDYCNS